MEESKKDVEIETALDELIKQANYLEREINSNEKKISNLVEQARELKRANNKAKIKRDGINKIIKLIAGN